MSDTDRPVWVTDATLREHVENAVVALADTKLILGYHYGEWTFGPPAIEAGIAACSMAQEEFGHTRLFHRILKQEFGTEIDPLNDTRDADAFASIAFLDRPFENWAELVAANLVVDQSLSLYVSAFMGSGFEPIARVAEKMLLEEQFHHSHAEGWVQLIEERGGAPFDAMTVAISRAVRESAAFFGPPDHDREVVEAGLKRLDDATLRDRLLRRIAQLVDDPESIGLTGGDDRWALADPPDWSGWLPSRRRTTLGGPQSSILDELRGTKNVAFKTA